MIALRSQLTPQRLGVQLIVLVLLGYPITSFSLVYFGISVAVAYRLYVLLVCLALLLHPAKSSNRLDPLLAVFFALYFVRLLFDGLVTGIEGAGDALTRFIGLVLIPSIAITRAGNIDEVLASKWIVRAAGIFVILSYSAYFLDLNYNPWADLEVLTSELNRLRFEGLNPISIGHATVSGIIAALFVMIATRVSVQRKVLLCLFLTASLGTLLLANSRGPLLALCCALLIPLLSGSRYRSRVIGLGFALFVGLFFLYAFTDVIDSVVNTVYDRIFFRPDDDLSNLGRMISQRIAIDAFLSSPVFGAFYRDPNLAINEYPHNLVIEAAMALGAVGLVLFLMVHFTVMYRIVAFLREQQPLLSMLLMQQIVAVSLSGTIYAADAFFVVLSATLGVRRFKARHLANKTQLIAQGANGHLGK